MKNNHCLFDDIGNYVDYIQPTKYIVSNINYSNNHNLIPVLTAGKTFILGYTNDKDGIFYASKENPIILFDDFTTSSQWVDFPFKVKSSACKILKLKDNSNCSLRFMFHMMKKNEIISKEHTRKWIGDYSKIKFPIAPLNEQNHIANILDKFTIYTNELTNELTNRIKQFEYYRNQLLNFEENKIPINKLVNIAKIKRGERITKKNLDPNGQYIAISGGEGIFGKINKYNRDENTITIAQYGSAGFINYQTEKFWANDVCYSLFPNPKIVNNKYLYYYLKNMQKYIYTLTTKSIPNHLPLEQLENLMIPIPPLEEQERIVNILDKFSALIDEAKGLIPKEIELRKKQYEYYRDKLLSFSEDYNEEKYKTSR